MKLSQIKGEKSLDVIADIMIPLGNIATDPEARKAFANETKEPVLVVYNKLIKSHKNDLYNMLAILDGVETEKYAKTTNVSKTLLDFADIINDKAVQSLFFSVKPAEDKN